MLGNFWGDAVTVCSSYWIYQCYTLYFLELRGEQHSLRKSCLAQLLVCFFLFSRRAFVALLLFLFVSFSYLSFL